MTDFVDHAITVFLGFFAIMNPIANTAVFAGLVGDKNRPQQIKIAIKSLFVAFMVIVVFAALGKGIFHLFGITMPALRIAGGILVSLIGYHMLQGSKSKLHHTESDDDDDDIAISPLAVPLLAGPGTIATAMNFSASNGMTEIAVTIAMFAVLCLITFICFMSSAKIVLVLGSGGLSIVTRLMGLILAVIGIQMLLEGISGFVHLTFLS